MEFLQCRGLAIAIACGCLLQSAESQTVTWGNSFGDTLLDSEINDLDAEFRFELGTFVAGFNPADQDPSLWSANWEGFDRADADNSGFNPAVGFFSRSIAITESGQTTSDAFDPEGQDYDFRGSQAYIWAYRDDTVTEDGNEFALLTDADWNFPDLISITAPPLEFRLSLSNQAIVGQSQNAIFALTNRSRGHACP